MFRKVIEIWILSVVISSCAMASEKAAPVAQPIAKLTAAEIADRNVAARGGLQAWRSVQSMTMTGKMEAGGNRRSTLAIPGRKDGHYMPPPRPAEQVRLPFVMDLKRPHKERIEIDFNNQTAIQVYDGNTGWKLRPFLNRREVEPYTEEEMKSASVQFDLDGPLVDYAAKGTTIELAGTEKIEGHDTYKLKLTMKNGRTTSLWIDSATFLDVKIEGIQRRLDGKYHQVEIYYRDFHTVNGLKIPFILETRVLNLKTTPSSAPLPTASEQITIEKVEVNPKLPDELFLKADLDAAATAKPGVAAASVKTVR